MKRTICAFAIATLICAATYEASHAAPIAPLTLWSIRIATESSCHSRAIMEAAVGR
jgi:hypothetical protein